MPVSKNFLCFLLSVVLVSTASASQMNKQLSFRFSPDNATSQSGVPEIICQRDGDPAWRFCNGEQIVLSKQTDPGNEKFRLAFEINLDGELPQVSEIAYSDGLLSALYIRKNMLYCTLLDNDGKQNTFPVPILLLEKFWNKIDIAFDRKILQISVNDKEPLQFEFVNASEKGLKNLTFGNKNDSRRFRGMLRKIVLEHKIPNLRKMPVVVKTKTPDIIINVKNKLPQKYPLHGQWDFCYSGLEKMLKKLPNNNDFDGKMLVPGFWDDHYELFEKSVGFGRTAKTNPRYRPMSFPLGETAPDVSMPYLVGTGFYRKTFILDSQNKNISLVLNVGPSILGSAVYCNGKLVAENTGYLTGYKYLLDPFLNYDGVNEIIIRISNYRGVFYSGSQENSQHIGVSVRGYQGMRAGINGFCFLELSGKRRIEESFQYLDKQHLLWTASVNDADKNTVLKYEVSDADGNILRQGKQNAVAGKNLIDLGKVDDLKKWCDREPVLYRFKLSLLQNEKVSDVSENHYGIREVTCSGPRIIVNGKAVFFRGLTEHHVFPVECNAHFDKEKYLQNIRKFKALGFNFLRFHTWCPPEPYLDAADELGMYAQIEVPPHASEADWRAVMKLIRRHPSAVIVCAGNEEDFDDFRMNEVRNLSRVVREMCPGMLFNPQEGLSKVDYRLLPDAPGVVTEPLIHDPKKLAQLAEFSDVYGSYSWGFFSYISDEFPGVAEVQKRLTVYNKPILSHEIGILGGFLNYANEKKYTNTKIPGNVYQKSREYLQKEGVFHRVDEFYRKNAMIVNHMRKTLVENLRRCIGINGYDYLGAFDAHWHRSGYPCGLMDEFLDYKYGVVPEEVIKYNGETVLLCDAEIFRNYAGKDKFIRNFEVSHFGKEYLPAGELYWSFNLEKNRFEQKGTLKTPAVKIGTLQKLGGIKFDLPEVKIPEKAILKCTFVAGNKKYDNHWFFWVFPKVSEESGKTVLVSDKLDDKLIDRIAAGKNVLLTGNFPCNTAIEKAVPMSTGRNIGHFGTIIHKHPLMDIMPHEGFGDFQFYPLLYKAVSMDFSEKHLPFNPLIEYIPSFKLVKYKTVLCELQIGKGRLMMCGLRLNDSDASAKYFRSKILDYLDSSIKHPAPAVPPELLKELCKKEYRDGGMSKTDEAWDPNVSGGKLDRGMKK